MSEKETKDIIYMWAMERASDGDVEACEAFDMAIKALEEIQQYRAIGTVEEVKQMKENGFFTGNELAIMATNLIVLQDYQAIGTVEQCREGVEMMMPKKPYEGRFGVLRCSCCDEKVGQKVTGVLKEDCMNFCAYCGRKVDWSE